jgi:hypothetical protein
MQYRNNVRYEGVYGGIHIAFTLQNFSQKTVEAFNEKLAKEALKHEQRGSGLLRQSVL